MDCCHPLPLEPDGQISPHPAQAFQTLTTAGERRAPGEYGRSALTLKNKITISPGLSMKLCLLTVLLFLLTCCEPRPRVEVKRDIPLTFSVSRQPIGRFEVCCVRDLEPRDRENYLWTIERKSDDKVNLPLEIVYGVIPQGWKQVIPEDGKPLSLIAGRKYSYCGFGSGGDGGCFEIREGKFLDVDCAFPNLKIGADIKDGVELPQFSIGGDDYLFELLIHHDEDAPEKKLGDLRRIYSWQIRPANEYKRKLPIEIVYGALPEGYRQLEPEGNDMPEKLKSGMKYTYVVRGVNSVASGCFEMVRGKVCKVDCYYTEHCKK